MCNYSDVLRSNIQMIMNFMIKTVVVLGILGLNWADNRLNVTIYMEA